MPARKPPHRRHNRHTADLELRPDARLAVPDPPSDWLVATKRTWSEFWSSPQAALVMEADLPAVERLFSYRDELSRSMAAFRKDRFVEGSKGQPRLNPLSDHVVRLERLIGPLEDRFGVTPLARLRLGVTFGQAHESLDALMDVSPYDDDDPRLDAIEAEVTDG